MCDFCWRNFQIPWDSPPWKTKLKGGTCFLFSKKKRQDLISLKFTMDTINDWEGLCINFGGVIDARSSFRWWFAQQCSALQLYCCDSNLTWTCLSKRLSSTTTKISFFKFSLSVFLGKVSGDQNPWMTFHYSGWLIGIPYDGYFILVWIDGDKRKVLWHKRS